jgi:hypothetical protein
MDFYIVILKLHLIEITDHHHDLKSLVNHVKNDKTGTKTNEQ